MQCTISNVESLNKCVGETCPSRSTNPRPAKNGSARNLESFKRATYMAKLK